MPTVTIETVESGTANFGAQGGGQKAVWIVDGYTSEVTVYNLGLVISGPYLNGFIRNDVAVEPLGGKVWKITVTYGTTGMGGGPYPLGGPLNDGAPITPPTGDPGGGNSTDSTELTEGFSFGIAFTNQKYYQSLQTVSVTVATGGAGGTTVTSTLPALTPASIPLPGRDFKQAIGVADGRVEGFEAPPVTGLNMGRGVGRASVTVAYKKVLEGMVGRTNNAQFFDYAAGEALYLGCDAEYQQSSGWRLDHRIVGNRNKTNISISSQILVPAKKGFEALWVAYRDEISNGLITTVPVQANVEKIFEAGNFANLEIGV